MSCCSGEMKRLPSGKVPFLLRDLKRKCPGGPLPWLFVKVLDNAIASNFLVGQVYCLSSWLVQPQIQLTLLPPLALLSIYDQDPCKPYFFSTASFWLGSTTPQSRKQAGKQKPDKQQGGFSSVPQEASLHTCVLPTYQQEKSTWILDLLWNFQETSSLSICLKFFSQLLESQIWELTSEEKMWK